MDLFLQSHLKSRYKKEKKNAKPEKTGMAKYFDDDDSCGSSNEDSLEDDDFFIEEGEAAGFNSKSLGQSKEALQIQDMIDFDLVELLRFCYEMQCKYKSGENEEYEDHLMSRQLEVGKKTRAKTLIFDLDETLVRACFAKPTYKID